MKGGDSEMGMRKKRTNKRERDGKKEEKERGLGKRGKIRKEKDVQLLK